MLAQLYWGNPGFAHICEHTSSDGVIQISPSVDPLLVTVHTEELKWHWIYCQPLSSLAFQCFYFILAHHNIKVSGNLSWNMYFKQSALTKWKSHVWLVEKRCCVWYVFTYLLHICCLCIYGTTCIYNLQQIQKHFFCVSFCPSCL